MNDEPGVGVLNGVKDLKKEGDSVANGEVASIGVGGKISAFDEFQGEERATVVGQSCVIKPCDAGMSEASQDIAFAVGALGETGGMNASVRQFQGNRPSEELVFALG
jgi:hypothetical protein